MLKILHFSDFHLGVENYGRIDPETGLHTRTLDFLKGLDELVDFALAEPVDLVLFCGDAYKNREPTQTHQREFAKRVTRIASAGIPVLLVVGNHDLPHAIAKATSVEIFDILTIRNVHVADRLQTTVIPTRGGPVQVVALPWVRRSLIASREETKGLTIDEQNQHIEERVTQLLADEAEKLERELPAILASHVSLSTARYGSERGMMIGYDYHLMPSALADLGFDYIALGHIHKRQVLRERPPVVYPGSLHRLDFSDEEEEAKGFYVATLEQERKAGDRCVALDFHPVSSRLFLTVEVEIGPHDEDPTTTVVNAIRRRRVTDAIIRLQIKIPQEQLSKLSDSDIYRALDSAHFVAGVSRTVLREHRLRLGEVSAEQLTPLEALQRYLESKEPRLPKERKETLLRYGERLIRETVAEP